MAKFSKGQVVKTAKEINDYGRTIPSGSKAKIVNVYGNGWYDIEVDGKLVGHSVSDAILAKNATLNAAYSKTLEYIMSSVKPYMDKRIKGDQSWKYPMLVITVLRKVCDKAVMSAGRYDNGRPRHRIYDINCEKDGWKFSGNLIITGLIHRDDPDDVSAFDEYDMTLSLMNVGKATNSTNPVVANAIAWRARNALVSRYNPGDIVLYERRSPAVHTTVGGFMPGFREKTKIRLVAKRSGGLWDAKDDGGNKLVVDEADFMGKAQNAIAANFSARAKQEASKVVRNIENAVDSLNLVVVELEKSDDPNDAKLVEPVKKLRKDVNAVLWKAMSIR